MINYVNACCNTTISAILIVAIVAIYSLGVWSIASGKSSLNDIHSIAHAANPSHRGRSGWNVLTKRNAGTAIIGWGRDEKIDHHTAFQGETHFGTITEPIANHSGIFWIAMTIATSNHSFRLGQKANHIAIHSVHEWIVIIVKNKSSWPAFFHLISQNSISCSLAWTIFFAHIIISIPIIIPHTTHRIL